MVTAYAAEAAASLNSAAALGDAGWVAPSGAAAAAAAGERYRLRVPPYYLNLIDRSDPARCPIALQALPQDAEIDPQLPDWAQQMSRRAFGSPVPWRADAIGDQLHLVAPRLTHRYQSRALLHLTPVCAMYCRFCFRKTHLNDAEKPLYRGSFAEAFAYLAAHPEISEVILTGGDPLAVSTGRLAQIVGMVAQIPHLKVLRLHSRMPVTAPSRIDAALCRLFGEVPLRLVLVSHFNHPRELTAQATAALQALQRCGVVLLNQSVLLRRVNDRVDTLLALCEGLYQRGVIPYYLHHPDWTPGTFHFRTPITTGQAIVEQLAGRLSGPALPRYMLDVPGGLGKIQLTGSAVRQLASQRDGRLCGSLFAVHCSHTRRPATPTLYADLSFC